MHGFSPVYRQVQHIFLLIQCCTVTPWNNIHTEHNRESHYQNHICNSSNFHIFLPAVHLAGLSLHTCRISSSSPHPSAPRRPDWSSRTSRGLFHHSEKTITAFSECHKRRKTHTSGCYTIIKLLTGFLSGCIVRASFLKACRISRVLAPLEVPSSL